MSEDELKKEFLTSQNTENLQFFKLLQRARHVYSEAKRVYDYK